MYLPLTNFAINTSCEGNAWFGWPCDERAETLKLAYLRAPDDASRRQALDALHARLWEVLPLIPTGQYKQPHAWRNNVSGVLRATTAVYWNIEKK
jgi:peptide/nickel transport system substrate-binding protein